MRPAIALAIPFLLLMSISACTFYPDRPARVISDATGGESLERVFWNHVKAGQWTEVDRALASNYVATTLTGTLDHAATLAQYRQWQLKDYSLGDLSTELNGSTIVVTYFHATARCVSCLKIEDLTNAAMTTRFAGPIAEKRVVWRVVNIDEPENAHFVKDYGLYTKSVVVSEVKAGREVRWKNLDQVWKLLGDPEAFQGYVEREVQAFLEKA